MTIAMAVLDESQSLIDPAGRLRYELARGHAII